MRKIKMFVLLAAILFLLPGMQARAADTETLQLEAGTRQATVKMALKELQSFEGELQAETVAGPGTEPHSGTELQPGVITISSVKASSAEGVMCLVAGEKIFMVGVGEPVDTEITVELKFSADGEYRIWLEGGKTDANGEYKTHNAEKPIAELTILVGTSASADGTQPDDGTQDDSSQDDENQDAGDDSNDEDNTNGGDDSHDEDDSSDNGETTEDKVDYSALEQALKDADTAIENNEELKELQELLNKTTEGTILLDSENQEEIDQAAMDIQSSLNDLGMDTEAKSADSAKNSDLLKKLLNLAKFAVPILVILISLFLGIWFWKRPIKVKTADFEGAPDIDYDITEDDE